MAAAAAACDEEAPLLALSEDLVCAILLRLTAVHDLLSCSGACQRLRTASRDPQRVWRPLCHQRWGSRTALPSWLVSPPTADPPPCLGGSSGSSGGSASSSQRTHGAQLHSKHHHHHTPQQTPALAIGSGPDNYRCLYALLHEYEGFVGLWRGLGDGSARGTLYSFGWAHNCLEGVQVVRHPAGAGAVSGRSVFRAGPAYPDTAVGALDARTCVVKVQPRAGAARTHSAAVNAAAAVGSGSRYTNSSDAILGTSPPSSFCAQFAQFMATSVAPSGRNSSANRRKRNSGNNHISGSSGGAGGGLADFAASASPSSHAAAPPPQQFFQRLAVPKMTRQHPLAGVWTEVDVDKADEPLSAVSLSYDFGRSAARVVATNITGQQQGAAPAGARDQLWWVSASPLPQPWPAQELDLLLAPPTWLRTRLEEARDQRRQVAAAAAAAAAVAAALAASAASLLLPLGTAPSQQLPPQQQPQSCAAHAAPSRRRSSSAMLTGGGGAEPRRGGAPPSPPPPGAASEQEALRERGSVPQLPAPPAPLGVGPCDVVACYRGTGALGAVPVWSDGRLWVFADGDMAFVWVEHAQAGGGGGGGADAEPMEAMEAVYLARLDLALTPLPVC